MIELCNKFSAIFSMQKRNIHLLKESFRDQITVEQNTMEVEGNVVKVKMSKFRPTMDFNKVKQISVSFISQDFYLSRPN